MVNLRLLALLPVAALTLAALPSTASAAPTSLRVEPFPSTISYVGHSPILVSYFCAGLVDGTSADDPVVLSLSVSEVRGSDGDWSAAAGGRAGAVCDGSPQTTEVPLLPLNGTGGDEILDGPAQLQIGLVDPTDGHSYGLGYVQQVIVSTSDLGPTPTPTPTAEPSTPSPSPSPSPTPSASPTLSPTPTPTPTSTPTPPPPPAPKVTVALTTNASPETVVKGKKITVKGTVKRGGKKYKTSTALEFAADGNGFSKVKTVRSSSKGALKATVTASRSGSFRFTYAGDKTTEPGRSASDHIVVKPKPKPAPSKPKPKAYKNCKALVKVYPHGVGKTGAHDKGGDVTDFTRDNKTYAKNKKSDRDKDGIACER